MNQQALRNAVWQRPAYFIAFGFGSGLMPVAPGTWGTLVGIPLYLFLLTLTQHMPYAPFLYLAITLLFFYIGVVVSNCVTKELGIQDYKGIVWDEVVGYLFTMFLAPKGWVWMGLGFLLFRLFDIWKPQPIRWIDKHVSGGLGVMLDDVLAAVPAWLIIQLIAWGVAE